MPLTPASSRPPRRFSPARARGLADAVVGPKDALPRPWQPERQVVHERDLVNGIILHELANAVAVVSGAVELVKGHEPAGSTFEFAMERVSGGVRMMDEILRGLGVLLGEGHDAEPQFERGGLEDFVREVVTDPVLVAENIAGRVRVISRLERGSQPRHCRSLLRHALSNLMRNALRHTDPDEAVTVLIGGRGDLCWIHILNHGPKIREDVAPHLFRPGRKDTGGGMGIGLYITRTCAVKMGGRLVYGSTGRATVFSLLFNAAEEDAGIRCCGKAAS